ncbi:hypothetical protein SAMN05421810_105312 [Amycolatopsis arida]|uniref:Uncharacterized protein n=1 Tax=Amycolatopsis arida TaxID=587909 RepID=A0A1I5WWH1_9PSEU|nr:DUF6350 family protein [Amycolatopsis arida]TDX92486.1 hypothetical protein CLV69_105331 [Amycolatopsis arida]SFQ24029.1 hypothetical protein SAMN05421810_105312 [Amycolatopsis arida]
MQLPTLRLRRETVDDPGTEPGDVPAVSRAAWIRAMLAAALGPLIAGYVAVVALFALVTGITTEAAFEPVGVLRAAAPGWLAAYQVPVRIGGQPLGVLPLLPTVGALVLVARSAARAARRLGLRAPAQAVPLVAAMAGGHVLAAVAVVVLSRNAPVGSEPLPALLLPALLAGVAATVGLAGRCRLVEAARHHLDPLALRGLRAGALGTAALLTAGAATYALGLALSAPTVHTLFGTHAPGPGSGTGLLLLSLGYLPNAVVGALSFAAGPGFSLGATVVTPMGHAGEVLPGLPLLAAVPETDSPWWWALAVLPAAAGALVGWRLRAVAADPRVRLRAVVVAGALSGFGAVVLGTFAGGRLGHGPFDPVTVPAGPLSIAVFAWITVPGGLVAWFAGPRSAPPPEPAEAQPDATEPAERAESTEPAEPAESETDGATDGTTTEDGAAETAEIAEPEVDGDGAEPDGATEREDTVDPADGATEAAGGANSADSADPADLVETGDTEAPEPDWPGEPGSAESPRPTESADSVELTERTEPTGATTDDGDEERPPTASS